MISNHIHVRLFNVLKRGEHLWNNLMRESFLIYEKVYNKLSSPLQQQVIPEQQNAYVSLPVLSFNI